MDFVLEELKKESELKNKLYNLIRLCQECAEILLTLNFGCGGWI